MEYRNLGNSGLKVSELSFGSWVTFVNQLGKKKQWIVWPMHTIKVLIFLIMLKLMHQENLKF